MPDRSWKSHSVKRVSYPRIVKCFDLDSEIMSRELCLTPLNYLGSRNRLIVAICAKNPPILSATAVRMGRLTFINERDVRYDVEVTQ